MKTTATITTETTASAPVKKKRFYAKNETIWIRALKKKGRIKSIDIPNLQATVTYFEGKDNLKEVTLKFMEIDKLRDHDGEVVVQQKRPATSVKDNKEYYTSEAYRNSVKQEIELLKQKKDIVKFAKVSDDAIIPSKREEDGAYDVYARQNSEDITIAPGQIVLVPTGIASAFDAKYRFVLKERSSTGIKALSVRAGIIDSGFRNEWKVVLNNTSNRIIIITSKVVTVVEENTIVYYPITKAIAQAKLEIVPVVNIEEIPYSELLDIPSERQLGGFGDSGK